MNPFRPLVDAVQTAAINAHGTDPDSEPARQLAAAEAQLAAALPSTEEPHLAYLGRDTSRRRAGHLAYMLRVTATWHAEHLAKLDQLPGPTCSCWMFCDSREVVTGRRQVILTLGLTPGDPVVEVGFSRTTGAVWLNRLFVRGCGGPHAGDYIGGGVDGDTCGRSGGLTNRNTDAVEALLLRQGWRVVDFDEAAQALTAAGFDVSGGCGSRGELDRFHALRPGETGPGRWRVTNPDCDEWTQRAVAVRVTKP